VKGLPERTARPHSDLRSENVNNRGKFRVLDQDNENLTRILQASSSAVAHMIGIRPVLAMPLGTPNIDAPSALPPVCVDDDGLAGKDSDAGRLTFDKPPVGHMRTVEGTRDPTAGVDENTAAFSPH
jgi:hypothetical protein